MDLSSIASGLTGNALWDRIKSWFGISEGGEGPVKPQAEALANELPDKLDTIDELKEGLEASGGYRISYETEEEGLIRTSTTERKSVGFDFEVNDDP